MESIFTLEPVEHLKDVMLAIVDATLNDALRIAQEAASESHPVETQLSACLEALGGLDAAALQEAAQPLQPYICQLEFAFLKLARQAFGQHCANNRLSEATMDMSLEDTDIAELPAELTGEVLGYFAGDPCVVNARYFDYEPINKSVLMQRAFRSGLHAMVLRHVRFVPVGTGGATPVVAAAGRVSPRDRRSPARVATPMATPARPASPAASPVTRSVIAAAHTLTRMADGTPRPPPARTPRLAPADSASQVAPSPRIRDAMEDMISRHMSPWVG